MNGIVDHYVCKAFVHTKEIIKKYKSEAKPQNTA